MKTSKSYQEFLQKIASKLQKHNKAKPHKKDEILGFMTTAISQTDIKMALNDQKNPYQLIALVFTNHKSKIGKEIFDQIDTFNASSENFIDFYFAGYTDKKLDNENLINMQKIDQKKWNYDPESFVSFRKDWEKKSTWKYSGESDLILITAYLNNGMVVFDYDTAMICNLQDMLEEKKIKSIGSFFQDIFRYAEENEGNTQASKFQDEYRKKVVVNLVKKFPKKIIFKLIEKWIPFGE